MKGNKTLDTLALTRHIFKTLMGGSGGSFSFGSFGNSSRSDISCEALRFRTPVINPDISVFSEVNLGTVLIVSLTGADEESESIDVIVEIIASLQNFA